jgi:hypothetical protein
MFFTVLSMAVTDFANKACNKDAEMRGGRQTKELACWREVKEQEVEIATWFQDSQQQPHNTNSETNFKSKAKLRLGRRKCCQAMK